MNPRKQEIRQIMLDIISGKVPVKYPPNSKSNLFIGVATVLEEREGPPPDAIRSFATQNDPVLGRSDELIALEIFWDLIFDRVITPGLDRANPFPFFRPHSEWTP